MKNLLDIFGRKDDNSGVAKTSGILNKPGDRLVDDGNSKYSATQYPNGTVVETKCITTPIQKSMVLKFNFRI